MYEALRAYYVEARESQEVARAFGYSPGSFRVLCHSFRRDPNPTFFVQPQHGPRTQPKKSAAYERVVALRKRAHLPIIRASGLLDTSVPIPWWMGRPLHLSA
jgi:hypothetical protein